MFHSIYEILFSNYFHKVFLQNNVIKNSRNCASFTKIIIIFCHVSSNKFLKVRANNIMLSIFERKHCFLKVCHDILLLFYALNPSLIYHCCFPYQQQSSFLLFCPVFLWCVPQIMLHSTTKKTEAFHGHIVH